MKYDHDGMIQHIRDNYPKAQAQFLIDEYKAEMDIMTDGDFGGGGTISEPKFSYDWADSAIRTVNEIAKKEKEIKDLVNTDNTPDGKCGIRF